MLRSTLLAYLAVGVAGVAGAHGGTLAVPGTYSTIQSAIDASSNGDTILVAPGQYTQNLNFESKSIAVRSTAGPATTIISVNGGTAVQMGPNSELTGFTVTGASAAFGAGIAVSGNGALIKGNIFQGNAETAGGYGAAIGGNVSSPTIVGNIFRNNTADGQFLSGVVCFVNDSSPVIENNVFVNNPTRAINLTLPIGNQPRVINNTFVGNTVAIREDNRVDASIHIYRNNIIDGNGTGLEDDFGSASDAPVWQNNLMFNNTTDYNGIPSLNGIMGNLVGDPRFVSATDFHITSGSAAIGAGSPLLAPADDFDGNFRPSSSIDIGAFQVSTPEPGALGVLSLAGVGILLRRKPK